MTISISQQLHNFLNEVNKIRQNDLIKQKKAGKLIVGYFCNYTPPELIDACGAIPIRILDNMNHSMKTQGRKWIQRDSCSYCKAALGNLKKNTLYSCIVSGTTCDQMRRLHELVVDENLRMVDYK